MLKPSDIEKIELKKGLGYKRVEVDTFLQDVKADYESLYNENRDLKDKLTVLSDGLQYYKSIEKTLQKALVLAQKTSDDNHAEAMKRAKTIEIEARVKADKIVNDAKKELNDLKSKSSELIMKINAYKSQLKALAQSQLDLLEQENFNLHLSDMSEGLEEKMEEADLEAVDETSKLMPYIESNEYSMEEVEETETLEGTNPEEEDGSAEEMISMTESTLE